MVSRRVFVTNLYRIMVAIGLCTEAAFGQNASKKPVPDLSGFWERKDEIGGGNFGGTLARIPRAEVKPEIIAEAKRAAAAQARGEVVSYGSK